MNNYNTLRQQMDNLEEMDKLLDIELAKTELRKNR